MCEQVNSIQAETENFMTSLPKKYITLLPRNNMASKLDIKITKSVM